MKKKKIIALLATAVMAVSLFAGCGSKDSAGKNQQIRRKR